MVELLRSPTSYIVLHPNKDFLTMFLYYYQFFVFFHFLFFYLFQPTFVPEPIRKTVLTKYISV